MAIPLLQLTYTLETIDAAVQQFWAAVPPYRILAFSGDMGAGKTTFIHHLCDHLEVEDAVSSPTFALINEYHFANAAGSDHTIYHMDWYRVKSAEEAMEAGMEDCILQTKQHSTFCFIEWPEKALELLTLPHLWITITATDRNEREMVITAVG